MMTNAEITVRPLVNADRPAWTLLYDEYLASMERSMPSAAVDRVFARLSAGETVRALLSLHAGRPVGFAHYLFHANVAGRDVAYLQDLFTEEPLRGRGVGRALIAAVTDAARTHGCGRLYWHTNTANTIARRLYDDVAEYRGVIRYETDL